MRVLREDLVCQTRREKELGLPAVPAQESTDLLLLVEVYESGRERKRCKEVQERGESVMRVSLLKYPTEEDWELVKRAALTTVDKTAKAPPSMEWKRGILEARHSPIRLLHFVFEIRDIPYWVSVHLCRHVHAVPFVRSQRNDRQSEYDRNSARQDAPVSMMWEMNAEELCIIANKRLCKMASKETRKVVAMMCAAVTEKLPEFTDVLVPACMYNGVCHEMHGGCHAKEGA
jgi:thymidylate synthase ThyX